VTQPDLFVVCRTCGSEVSPYVTECPYCGQRVRKRAPKLERGGTAEAPRRRRRRTRLPRLRPDEIEGIAPETRPWATMAVIVASLLTTVVLAANEVTLTDLGGIFVPIDESAWRWFASPFLHDNLGYQFVTLLTIGIFGSLLERRFGPQGLILVLAATAGAGSALATAAEAPPLLEDPPLYPVLGFNGAALGLLTAWLVDDRLAARRGEDRESDRLGVYVIAALLVSLSLAVEEANVAAAAGGAAAGALLGVALGLLPRRA
jgi:membrane associated rhomboid family serine protease